MGLTRKILLFTSALVVTLVATTLAITTFQASRLARASVERGLVETRGVWETFQGDRYDKLKLGIRVLGNDPAFKALVEGGDPATILDTLRERNLELKADFFLATDPEGLVLARTDRPAAQGQDLSGEAVVRAPLEGEESATVWREGGRLFHAVSVPMTTGPELKGVLVAGYAIDEALAGAIRKLTHSEVACVVRDGTTRVAASTLGSREEAFAAALPRLSPEPLRPFAVDLGGERFTGIAIPLQASGGEVVGAVVPLRSVTEEMAVFRRFRNGLVAASLVVMVFGLGVAYLAATKIAGPVRELADLVERVRSGSYTGAVAVGGRDEIGTLARAFNGLLADLREKDQLITFLREGATAVRPVGDGSSAVTAREPETVALGAVTPGAGLPSSRSFGGRYEILSTLGKGGMGVVYRALDRQLGEEVALKVLRPDVLRGDPTLLERFKQEIRLARRITHRNVLRTHDFGEAEGTPYISMEYLEGVPLKDLLRSKGALPVPVGLRIAKQICHGLEAAHQQGVVHRDVKPQNMLVLPGAGELKIMDFGIARRQEVAPGESGLTTAGTVMGTPDYMSPEQAQGRPADFRSDIYSLGVVLYEVFSGALPFTGDTAMEVVLAHIQKPSPPLRSADGRVPPELAAVVARCLEKDPARRYQRIGDLLRELNGLSSRLEAA